MKGRFRWRERVFSATGAPVVIIEATPSINFLVWDACPTRVVQCVCVRARAPVHCLMWIDLHFYAVYRSAIYRCASQFVAKRAIQFLFTLFAKARGCIGLLAVAITWARYILHGLIVSRILPCQFHPCKGSLHQRHICANLGSSKACSGKTPRHMPVHEFNTATILQIK